MKRILTLVACLLLGSGAAFAHAHLRSAVPASGAAVKVAPKVLRLTFSEAVNARFSIFKVYPVALSATPTDTGAAADRLEKSAIMARGDLAQRADSGVQSESGSTVTLKLKSGLRPGVYAVLWKVMAADDGHITQGDFTFTVAGGRSGAIYVCPMHPQVMGLRGGVACPKCRMKLIEVKARR